MEYVKFMCMLANPCVQTWVIWVVFNFGCVRVESSSKEGSRIHVYEDSLESHAASAQANKFEVQSESLLNPSQN
jgi:hypothetical protein